MHKQFTRLAATGLVVAGLALGSMASANAQTESHNPAPHTSVHGVKMSGSALTALIRSGAANRTASTARMARDLTEVEAATGAAASSLNCFDGVDILSLANGDFVSAELGYPSGTYGMLRARSFIKLGWENFGGCRNETTGLTNIKSDANGLWVSAELGYTGGDYAMLRARARTIGPWENWYTDSDPGGLFPNVVGFTSAANGLNVSAELGYTGGNYGELRARTATANLGPWEVFEWCVC